MARFCFSRRAFIHTVTAGAVAAWLENAAWSAENQTPPLPGTPTSHTHPETCASLTVASPANFKILQLTDAHFHQRREQQPKGDERSLDEWKRMVDLYRPDLIAITGDFWHDNPDGRGEEFLRQSVARVESLGVPWLFTWGNHDQLTDYAVGHDVIHDAKGSLYRGGPTGGNYTVDVVNKAGNIIWQLICLNTHREGMTGPTVDWLKGEAKQRRKQARAVPAFAFFHIPIRQYYEIRKGDAAGIFLEGVSHQREDGSALKLLKGLGNVRATFCGHDHVNDYSGTHQGIELVYGRASGWCGYGWEKVRKGGKLITLNGESGNYAWETVFPDGIRWRPANTERIQEVLDQPWMKDPLAADEAA